MRTPGRLPHPLDVEPFSVASAMRLGVSRRRVRAGDLDAPFHGVRTRAAANGDSHARLLAYASKMPAGNFFSHATAARLWGIPLPWSVDRDTHVATPSGRPLPRGAGVRGHRLRIMEADVATRLGLPVTSAARTWCDLAGVLSREDLVAAGDFLLWRRRPNRLSESDLVSALDRFEGRRGRPALDATLPLLSDRSDSPPESVIRYRALQAGLPSASPNYEIRDARGGFVAQPDLAFVEYRVCFDYEGEHHFTDAAQWSKDLGRVRRIEDEGWSHVRGGRTDLRDSTALFRTLRHRLRSRGWTG